MVIISRAEDTTVNLFITREKKALKSPTQKGKNDSLRQRPLLKPAAACILFTPETALELGHTRSSAVTELYKCPRTAWNSAASVALKSPRRPIILPRCLFPGTGVSRGFAAVLLQLWELPGRGWNGALGLSLLPHTGSCYGGVRW